MIFDFSQRDTWMRAVRGIVDGLFPAKVIEAISKSDPEDMYSDTLSYLLEALETSGDYREYEQIVSEIDAQFVSMFSEVKAFHGCRIVNERTYRTFGIRTFDRQLLKEIAFERLSDHADPKEIEAACDEFEIHVGRHGVYFFLSLSDASLQGQNHYSKCGSEALQGIMNSLGLASKGILSRQGNPCVIEFDVPPTEIQSNFRRDLWRTLVTLQFKVAAGYDGPIESKHWGFATSGGMPPQRLREFHYLSDSELNLISPLH